MSVSTKVKMGSEANSMYSIDEIMDMLDWNNLFEIQKKGANYQKK